jgi:hypothetical protein
VVAEVEVEAEEEIIDNAISTVVDFCSTAVNVCSTALHSEALPPFHDTRLHAKAVDLYYTIHHFKT